MHSKGDGTMDDPIRPEYSDEDGVIGYSGNRIETSPTWVVRITAEDEETLDDISEKNGVTGISDSEAANYFDDSEEDHIPSIEWDSEKVNERFNAMNSHE